MQKTIMLPRTGLRLALVAALALWATDAALAGSATWKLNPTSGDWNTAANWSPSTVPNGAADTESCLWWRHGIRRQLLEERVAWIYARRARRVGGCCWRASARSSRFSC